MVEQLSTGRVVRAAALAAVVFGLLLLVPGPRQVYPRAYRALANFVFHSFGSDRVVRFDPFEDPAGIYDTRMMIGTTRLGLPKGLSVNSVRQGYVPTALFVALALATPVPWRRRSLALFVGLVLIHLFIGLRIVVSLSWGFSIVHYGPEPLLELPRGVAWLVRRADQILTGDLFVTYLAPLVIWAAVALRTRDAAPEEEG